MQSVLLAILLATASAMTSAAPVGEQRRTIPLASAESREATLKHSIYPLDVVVLDQGNATRCKLPSTSHNLYYVKFMRFERASGAPLASVEVRPAN
jgi:hypothetical protein